MCGEEAAIARHSLDIKYPVENGIVKLGYMETCGTIHFENLQINPAENKVLLTEPAMNPAKNREKLVEEMFENYNFVACSISIQAMPLCMHRVY